jgi:hypothetical protein
MTSHGIINNIASSQRDMKKYIPLWLIPRTQLLFVIYTQIIIIVIQLVLTFHAYSWGILRYVCSKTTYPRKYNADYIYVVDCC